MDDIIRQYIRACVQEGPEGQQAMLDRFHGAGHDSAHKNPYDLDFDQEFSAFSDALRRGKTLKQAFAQYADRRFIDSLVYVHWAWALDKEIHQILRVAKDGIGRDELSCRAYLPGEKISGATLLVLVGFVVSGHVTLLANDHDNVYSGASKDYVNLFPDRTRDSGANKGVFAEVPDQSSDPIFVLEEDDWKPRGIESERMNEALVDNWTVDRILVVNKTRPDVESVMKRLGMRLPIEVLD